MFGGFRMSGQIYPKFILKKSLLKEKKMLCDAFIICICLMAIPSFLITARKKSRLMCDTHKLILRVCALNSISFTVRKKVGFHILRYHSLLT